MAIWSELARASNDAGDEILLRRRDDIYEIRYNGLELMSNVNYQSETVLAERSLRLLERVPQRILIGGLGMGFTLKAALDCLPEQTKVTVCELVPEIISWNQTSIGHLAGFPLSDPRVDVRTGDVMETLAQSRNSYDLILMDTDNGPDFLVRNGNDTIYAQSGLTTVDAALTSGGIASFWSATASASFEALLDEMDYAWERHDICLIGGRSDAFHYIYFITKEHPVISGITKNDQTRRVELAF
ncbi:hypothetical protein [Brucella rhizosphaerae]|uniref:Spermine/spermidine synthase family protein n=1 Tax=Brucella rhizosphaerae TaxID=571254 RepID=A0A256FKR1_9HYPH|nr:hypothetical protein [Brucella rhizosphaerae]OYR15433.1 spermine/spermidine synthase family protein [Brucella rhizosphaerae]